MYDMKPLIQKFRGNRKRLGINQREFASRLGTSLATITRWERGNMIYTPNLRQLSLIADMFETTVWELLTPDTLENVTNDEARTAAEPLTTEVESTTQGTSPIATNDEISEEQPAIPIVTSDEALEAPSLVNTDETSKESAADEAQELVSTDEIVEAPADVPEDTSQNQDQAPDAVMPDEPTPAAEPLSTGLPESVITDETVEEQAVPQIVNIDEAPTKDDHPQELFSIVPPDENQIEAEALSSESETAPSETQSIITNDEVTEEQPSEAITAPDDIAESVIIEEVVQGEPPSATSDETSEGQTTAPIVTPDDMTEPVTNDEIPTEGSADPELFSIITPDETTPITDDSTSDANDGQENPAIAANAETPQEATTTEATSDTSPELATDKQTKPWEALGMSRAWYYRLRQRGQLEEYLKEKNK